MQHFISCVAGVPRNASLHSCTCSDRDTRKTKARVWNRYAGRGFAHSGTRLGPLRIRLTNTRQPLVYHPVCAPAHLVDLRQPPVKELRQGSACVPRMSALKSMLSEGRAKRTDLGINFEIHTDYFFSNKTIPVLVWISNLISA